jgi:hypothetical protein
MPLGCTFQWAEQADWSPMFILSMIYDASDKERPEGEHNANDSDHI